MMDGDLQQPISIRADFFVNKGGLLMEISSAHTLPLDEVLRYGQLPALATNTLSLD